MWGWRRSLIEISLSPLVLLPMLAPLVAAISLGSRFGSIGVIAGLLLGVPVGFGLAFLWYHLITEKGRQREQTFRDTLIRDHRRGALHQRRSHSRGAVEPIALEPTPEPHVSRANPPVDIATDVATAVANVEERARTDLPGALHAAEALNRARPRDGRTASLLARLLLRSGQTVAACGTASHAIHVAMLGGDNREAAATLATFWERRSELTFDPATVVALAETLRDAGEADQARWCIDRASGLGTSAEEIERLRRRLSRA